MRDIYSKMDLNQLLLSLVSQYSDDPANCRVMLRHVLRGCTLEEAIELTEASKKQGNLVRERNRRLKNQWGIEDQ